MSTSISASIPNYADYEDEIIAQKLCETFNIGDVRISCCANSRRMYNKNFIRPDNEIYK